MFEGADATAIDRDVVPIESLPHGTVRADGEVHFIVGKVGVWSFPALNNPNGPHLHDGDVAHPQGFGYGSHTPIADRIVF